MRHFIHQKKMEARPASDCPPHQWHHAPKEQGGHLGRHSSPDLSKSGTTHIPSPSAILAASTT